MLDTSPYIADKTAYALDLKHSGHNCAQAVLGAFAEETGISHDDAKRLAAAFGAGMGNMEGTCGALVAAEMLLGLAQYVGRPVGGAARNLHQAFAEHCGATICKDIKGRDTGVVLCPCDECVRFAAELAAQIPGLASE